MVLCTLIIAMGAAPAIAVSYDYAAEVNQTAAWLVTQQITSGGNLGGIEEYEGSTTIVESDNTQEAIWIWSRYAELTGDYTTYQTKINNAWTYLNNFPAWNEGGSITNYYTTYNCAWGMRAEMKYRQVYLGKAGYVDHTAYGRRCASTLHQGNCGTSGSNGEACVLGLAAGALYQYGLFDSNTVAQADALTFGNNVRTWLNGSTSNFSSDGWAVSAGVAVWGVMNSYFKDPNHSAEALAWAETANTYMPASDTGTSDGYQNGHNGWYAWGHYALSEVRGADSFTKYQNIINTLLGNDGDNDGGIPQQGSTGNDYAWTTDIMQTASNMGLVNTKNYTISGTITSGGSALAGVQMSGLPGVPVTDANGFYTATVTSGWIGTVTPIKAGYTFSPATKTYIVVISNQTAQNYTATALPPSVTFVAAGTAASGTSTISPALPSGIAVNDILLMFIETANQASSISNQNGGTWTAVANSPQGTGTAGGTGATMLTVYWSRYNGTQGAPTVSDSGDHQIGLILAFRGAVTTGNPWDVTAGGTKGTASTTTTFGTVTTTVANDLIVLAASRDDDSSSAEWSSWTNANLSGLTEQSDGGTTSGNGGGIGIATGLKATAGSTGSTTATVTSSVDGHMTIALKPQVATWTLAISTTTGGTVTTPGIGNFNYNNGTNASIVAANDVNYHFVNWTGSAVTAGKVASPTSASTTVLMDANYTVTANFAVNTRSLTTSATAGGTVSTPGIGTYLYNQGTSNPIIASNNTGYYFVNWTGTAVTAGKVASPTSVSTTVLVDANYAVQANFAINTYTLTYTPGANGTISGTSPQTVSYGGSGTAVTAVPNANYHFVNWSDGSAANPRTDTSVTANITVTANFAINTHTVTFVAGANGSITGTLVQVVNHGGNCTAVTAVPNANYHFTSWTGGYTGATNPLTITNVTADMTVTANFAIDTHTVTFVAGANGSITGTLVQVVNHGSSCTPVTAQANTNYHFTGWTGGYTGTTNPLTITNVTADMTITANFAIDTFTLTYTPGANGTISGTSPQTVNYNASGSAVTAVPSTGYHFVKWSDDSTVNPRTDTSVTANIAVTASFAIDTFTLTYTPGSNGTITGTSPQTVNYNASGSAVTAVPATGYHFVKWSDDSTVNPRTDTSVTANIAVTASFAIDTFTLTYTAGSNGTITGTSPQTINYNTSGSAVTAVPSTGYHFVKWSDDSTVNPRTDSSVTADIAVTASFAIDTFTLTYTAGSNGTISGTSPQTVNYNASGSAVTAVPATGYHFVKWSDDSVVNPRTDSSVTANIAVTASFAIDTFTLTYTAGSNGTITGTSPQTVNYNASGSAVTAVPATGYHFVKWSDDSTVNPRTDASVTANISVTASFAIDQYTITSSAGANGSIDPMGDTTKDYGSSQLFTATPTTGYEVDKWTLDGADAQTGGNTYTLSTITATHTVAVSFKIITYTVTASAGANGSIDPTGAMTKDYGSSQLFTATPATGYAVDKWQVDGADVQTGGTTYTLSSITATHTVSVSFKIFTYTVTASTDANGSVDPMGDITKDYGSSQLFTATPTTGYVVDKWMVDGSEAQVGGTTYTLSDITTTHTVAVTFSRIIFSISGYVVEIDGNTPVKDVLMSAGDTNTLTDANGYYELSAAYGWSGVITPGKQGYVFEPGSNTYNNVTQSYNDANYTATLMTFKIAGYVLDSGNSAPISNTSVSAENGGGPWTSKYGGGSAMTDASGYYEVWVDYNWSGKVTPTKYAYAFEPNSISYENVNADTTGQNYAGTLLTFKIAGYITNKCNVPIENVLVSADNGGGQAMTDANGFYEVWVSYAWTGTVTPTKKHFTFTPGNGSYVGVLVDQAGQNYTADNIYDLDCDGYIDLGDVKVICDNWLMTGTIPGDFDASGTVDFTDFAVFGNVWGD